MAALRGLEGASYEGLGRTESEFSPYERADQGSCEGYYVDTLGWHWPSRCWLVRTSRLGTPSATSDAISRATGQADAPLLSPRRRSHLLTLTTRLSAASPSLSARPGAEPRAVSKERAGFPHRPLSAATLVTLRLVGPPAPSTAAPSPAFFARRGTVPALHSARRPSDSHLAAVSVSASSLCARASRPPLESAAPTPPSVSVSTLLRFISSAPVWDCIALSFPFRALLFCPLSFLDVATCYRQLPASDLIIDPHGATPHHRALPAIYSLRLRPCLRFTRVHARVNDG